MRLHILSTAPAPLKISANRLQNFDISNSTALIVPMRNVSCAHPPHVNISFPHGSVLNNMTNHSDPTLIPIQRYTCAAGQISCLLTEDCCLLGSHCMLDGVCQAGCCPSATVSVGLNRPDNSLYIPTGTSCGISPAATGSSSNLRPPKVLGTLWSLFRLTSSELTTYVCAEDAALEGNNMRTDLPSTKKGLKAGKPHEYPAVKRFVPPYFDKDEWLQGYQRRPGPKVDSSSASRLAFNPFSYLGNLIASVLGYLGKAKALPVVANDTACEYTAALEGLGVGSALYDMWIRRKMALS